MIKPKPLSELNHFTKPVILLDIDTSFHVFELLMQRRWPVLQKLTYGALREEAHEEEYLRITLELRTALLKLLA